MLSVREKHNDRSHVGAHAECGLNLVHSRLSDHLVPDLRSSLSIPWPKDVGIPNLDKHPGRF
jgi:hypothetical protein